MTKQRTGVPTIRPGTDSDIDQITTVMAAAFLDTPEAPWLIPNRDQRHAVYRRYCSAIAAYTLGDHGGHIDVAGTDGRIHAVAVWYDYVHYPIADTQAHDAWRDLVDEVCGPHARRFTLLDATLTAHHPTTGHFHLAWLGVHPHRHGTGLGTQLLHHRHTHLDNQNIPSYLVATSHPARRLYTRHGYHDRDPTPCFLPDNGPALWPMWRNPRA